MRPAPKPPRRLSGALFLNFGRTKLSRGLGAGAPRNELIEQILLRDGRGDHRSPLHISVQNPLVLNAKFLFVYKIFLNK